jgi:predicted nuclease of predicted toxin-antitoxin system
MTTIWVDAHLSPRIARWMTEQHSVSAFALRDLGLRDAEDDVIYLAAKNSGAVLLTKDRDFIELLERNGSPPKVIWLTCGNTSDAALQSLLNKHLATALAMLDSGENLVEISSP